MSSRDFLHKDAQTPLHEHYVAGGAVCSFSTNCEQLLEAARGSFLPAVRRVGQVDFGLRLWVDDTNSTTPPWPKPYVRGLDHLVFLAFDPGSSMLVDLRTRRVIGRFSAVMARDSAYWRTVIFPMMMSILAGSIALVELHASCLTRGKQGLLLIGAGRSGKSTLAMALTEAGFSFLSDDRIFCSMKEGKLLAYGLPRPLKLRSDAASWFSEFCERDPTEVQNGELVFYCEPNRSFGRQNIPACEPRVLVFLERQQESGFCITEMDQSEARSRIEIDLLAEAPLAIAQQGAVLDSLMTLPCFRMRYGGRPQVVAEQIIAFLGSRESSNSSYHRQDGTT